MFINGIIAVFALFPGRGPWQGMMGLFYICTYRWYLVKEPERQFTGLPAEHSQPPKLLVHKARALCHSSPSLLWREFLFVREADLIENLVAPYSFCHGSVPSGARRQSWAVWEHCFCLPCSLSSWRNSSARLAPWLSPSLLLLPSHRPFPACGRGLELVLISLLQ